MTRAEGSKDPAYVKRMGEVIREDSKLIAELRDELEQAHNDYVDAQAEVKRLRAAVESYRKKLADKDRVLYDSEHDELREQVERLRGEVELLTQASNHWKDEVERLRAENSTLRSLLPDGVDVAGFEY